MDEKMEERLHLRDKIDLVWLQKMIREIREEMRQLNSEEKKTRTLKAALAHYLEEYEKLSVKVERYEYLFQAKKIASRRM